MATQIARLGATVSVEIPEDILRSARLAVGDEVEWRLTATGDLVLCALQSTSPLTNSDDYEQWKQEEISAGFAEIEAGESISNEKVIDWLRSWGTANELPPPLLSRRKKVDMRPSEVLTKHRETIRQIILDAGMSNPRVFGSVLHGDDQDDSDLDLLVDPAPRTSLLDMAGLQIALEKAVGIKVDVRTPGELHSRFREKVLAEAVAL